MKINVNTEKMYDLLSKEEKDKLAVTLENAFLTSKPLEDVVRFYLSALCDTKDEDLMINMGAQMLKRIIDGEESYVGHVYALKDETNDPFRVSAENIIGIFYPLERLGRFEIAIKGQTQKGTSYLNLATNKSEKEIPEYARVINFGKLCKNKNKTFSHESLEEIMEITKQIVYRYTEFFGKVFPVDEKGKELTITTL